MYKFFIVDFFHVYEREKIRPVTLGPKFCS